MKKIVVVFFVLMLLAFAWSGTGQAGGWAVITLHELPQDVHAGEPVTVRFSVRQHGKHPMEGLETTIRASNGNRSLSVRGAESNQTGVYTATLTFPTAGEWAWSISAFTMDVPMPAITVGAPRTAFERLLASWRNAWGRHIPAAYAQDAPSSAAEGKRIFLAKGCWTCHHHAQVAGSFSTNNGPDLTTFAKDAEFLHAWLRNAEQLTKSRQEWWMPTLELSDNEIDALYLFLRADQ
ncbi:MAG: c-type cytochrome [Chloroflexi bacterium]|nr:c-type cytochrome [Chloroflexota bacterium]